MGVVKVEVSGCTVTKTVLSFPNSFAFTNNEQQKTLNFLPRSQ
jgi:hypothetical protein